MLDQVVSQNKAVESVSWASSCVLNLFFSLHLCFDSFYEMVYARSRFSFAIKEFSYMT